MRSAYKSSRRRRGRSSSKKKRRRSEGRTEKPRRSREKRKSKRKLKNESVKQKREQEKLRKERMKKPEKLKRKHREKQEPGRKGRNHKKVIAMTRVLLYNLVGRTKVFVTTATEQQLSGHDWMRALQMTNVVCAFRRLKMTLKQGLEWTGFSAPALAGSMKTVS